MTGIRLLPCCQIFSLRPSVETMLYKISFEDRLEMGFFFHPYLNSFCYLFRKFLITYSEYWLAILIFGLILFLFCQVIIIVSPFFYLCRSHHGAYIPPARFKLKHVTLWLIYVAFVITRQLSLYWLVIACNHTSAAKV